jgi:aminoglycoside phosphotransferase (APT) family kinase protein
VASDTPDAHDLDAGRLDDWLRARLHGLSGPLRVERIGGGQSNPTYFLTYDNRRLVMRRRPDGEILPSAHAVDREYRVQSALTATPVKVPKVLLYEEDPAVVGSAFYLMERVEGRVFHDNTLAALPREQRRDVYTDLAATLAEIHRIDPSAVGLSDYGRHGGYFSRQVSRWTKQWQLSSEKRLPAIDRLVEWLPANMPDDDRTTLVHGDFRTGNMIIHPTEPRIAAVLDWELSTLGNPMADLAHTCAYIWMMNSDEFGVGLRDVDLAAGGLPTMQRFIADYANAIGREVRLTRWHLAFALFRNAVIFEGIADRARRGNAASENAREVGRVAPRLAERGAAMIDATDLPA